MRYSNFILFFIMISFVWLSCDKDTNESVEARLQQVLKDNFTDGYADHFPGIPAGVYIAVRNANTDVFTSYNVGDMTSRTHFKGASTTKSFTAAAILWLHKEGKLNIDHLITDMIPNQSIPYLPTSPEYDIPYKEDITIRMLLSHRAGVFDVTNNPMPDTIVAPYAGMYFTDYIKDLQGISHTFTFDELIEPVATHQVSFFPPDAGMHYSNTGYHLLGKIIERVSGLSQTAFNIQHFLQPLGMDDTYFADNGDQLVLEEPFLDCYLQFNGEVIEIEEDNLSSAIADGNIITTPDDLATWAMNLYGTTNILSADLLAQMVEPRETGEHHVLYGLGCEMHPPEIGHGHNGARAAFMTVMRYHPPTQTVFIVGSNTLYADDLYEEGEMLNEIVRDAIEVMNE